MASASIISMAAGMMPAEMIADTAWPAVSVSGNPASSVCTACGETGQADGDLGRDAERALGPDERAEQVVPGEVERGAADLDQLALRA